MREVQTENGKIAIEIFFLNQQKNPSSRAAETLRNEFLSYARSEQKRLTRETNFSLVFLSLEETKWIAKRERRERKSTRKLWTKKNVCSSHLSSHIHHLILYECKIKLNLAQPKMNENGIRKVWSMKCTSVATRWTDAKIICWGAHATTKMHFHFDAMFIARWMHAIAKGIKQNSNEKFIFFFLALVVLSPLHLFVQNNLSHKSQMVTSNEQQF